MSLLFLSNCQRSTLLLCPFHTFSLTKQFSHPTKMFCAPTMCQELWWPESTKMPISQSQNE